MLNKVRKTYSRRKRLTSKRKSSPCVNFLQESSQNSKQDVDNTLPDDIWMDSFDKMKEISLSCLNKTNATRGCRELRSSTKPLENVYKSVPDISNQNQPAAVSTISTPAIKLPKNSLTCNISPIITNKRLFSPSDFFDNNGNPLLVLQYSSSSIQSDADHFDGIGDTTVNANNPHRNEKIEAICKKVRTMTTRKKNDEQKKNMKSVTKTLSKRKQNAKMTGKSDDQFEGGLHERKSLEIGQLDKDANIHRAISQEILIPTKKLKSQEIENKMCNKSNRRIVNKKQLSEKKEISANKNKKQEHRNGSFNINLQSRCEQISRKLNSNIQHQDYTKILAKNSTCTGSFHLLVSVDGDDEMIPQSPKTLTNTRLQRRDYVRSLFNNFNRQLRKNNVSTQSEKLSDKRTGESIASSGTSSVSGNPANDESYSILRKSISDKIRLRPSTRNSSIEILQSKDTTKLGNGNSAKSFHGTPPKNVLPGRTCFVTRRSKRISNKISLKQNKSLRPIENLPEFHLIENYRIRENCQKSTNLNKTKKSVSSKDEILSALGHLGEIEKSGLEMSVERLVLPPGKWRKSLSIWKKTASILKNTTTSLPQNPSTTQSSMLISFNQEINYVLSTNRSHECNNKTKLETSKSVHTITEVLLEESTDPSNSDALLLEKTDDELPNQSKSQNNTPNSNEPSNERIQRYQHQLSIPLYRQPSLYRRRRTSSFIEHSARILSFDCELRSQLSHCDIVLRRCGQSEPLQFADEYSETILHQCRKIGEGVYGEVFMNKTEKAETVVLKIIPIEGSIEVNGEPQKKFDKILSEIVIAMELSYLHNDKEFMTSGFVEVKKVRCVKGRYPDHLIELWELYRENYGTENDHPEIFPEDQLYIVLELANGGQDLEAFTFQNALQSYSAFVQTALTLAVAELKFQFEHRDLHWGNILLASTDEKEIEFRINGKEIKIPTHGVKATIIDFTLSRMVFEGCSLYNDLVNDNELFSATGDYQFDIYRLMKKHLDDEWERFEPYTNILWLHYTLDKMISGARYRCSKSKKHRSAIQDMMQLRDELLDYKSASNYVECLN